MTIQEIIEKKASNPIERRLIAEKVRRAMGVSERHWYRIKAGKVDIKLHKARAAARVLGVSVHSFTNHQ